MPSGIYTLQAPIVSTDATLSTLLRDPLLAAPNSGVRFLMDTAFGFSYPGGPFVGRPAAAAPANNAPIYDVAELANGSFVLPGGTGAMAYAGGGFDFSGVTARGVYAQIPASVAADIWNAFGGNSQRWLMCCYLKLPLLADWSTTGGICGFMSFAAANSSVGNPDIATVGSVNGGQVQVVRQRTGGVLVNTSVIPTANHYGAMCQLATWRTQAGGLSISLRSAAGGLLTANNAGSNEDNPIDFSARTGQFGVGTAYWPTPIGGGANVVKFRMYRAFVENLARSGRDPAAVLDADWQRVQARIAANAAANGGISQIFA